MNLGTLRPILVVEDSDEDWETVREAARHAGVEAQLRRFPEAESCLLWLQGEGAQGAAPALLLLDLNLPGMGGRSLLAALKGDDAYRALPVVVLTTSMHPHEIVECYAAGANAYQAKPLRHPDHVSAVRALFAYWLDTNVLPDGMRVAPGTP